MLLFLDIFAKVNKTIEAITFISKCSYQEEEEANKEMKTLS
jgi:hypothetical protein